MKKWKKMMKHSYKEGEAVLRIKTEMDAKNPRNKMPGQEGMEAQLFYVIFLTPTTDALKRNLKRVSITLRPGDFLPVAIIVDMNDDVHYTVQFEAHAKDPVNEAEIKDERFKLEAPGFTQEWPQR